jgi:hypothetical protein
MTQEPSGDPALDDDFSGYFRPDQPAPTPPAETSTGTGRLFRSTGVDESTDAIPALRADQARKLRTAHRDDIATSQPIEPPEPELVLEGLTETAVGELPPPTIRPRPERTSRKERRPPGLRPGAVYVVDIVVTVLFAFIDVLIRSDGLGWITGIGMVIAAVYTALVVRQSDWVVTLIAPPLAFFAAAMTAGQINLGPSGDSILNRIAHVFFTLGGNWFWIVLAVAAAFAVSLVRQRRPSRP